jgi:hypothetical protein
VLKETGFSPPNPLEKGNGAAMTENDNDDGYETWDDTPPRRSQRTRFREVENRDEKAGKRNKPSGKRSHRQKTQKDDFWPDDE